MMGIRHLARQRAMQMLYALEYAPAGESIEDTEFHFLSLVPKKARGYGQFARQLARMAYQHRQELEEKICPLLRNWTLERLPCVDRLCLRMALCELREFPDIPMRVTINEYIELVRLFSTEESPHFVNAVLDRLAADFAHKDFRLNDAPAAVQEQSVSP